MSLKFIKRKKHRVFGKTNDEVTCTSGDLFSEIHVGPSHLYTVFILGI